MYQENRKKASIIYILKILRKYTDEDHHMTQQEIVDKLKSEYGIEVNRTTVKSNIEDLLAADYDIDGDKRVRKYRDPKTGEEEESTLYIRCNGRCRIRYLMAGLRSVIHAPGLLFLLVRR